LDEKLMTEKIINHEEEYKKIIKNDETLLINKEKGEIENEEKLKIKKEINCYEKTQSTIWLYIEQEKPLKTKKQQFIGFLVQVVCFVMISLVSVIIAIVETEELISKIEGAQITFFIIDTLTLIYFTFEIFFRIWACV
jgi:hypothetical protein